LREQRVVLAMDNAYAFGGNEASLILRKPWACVSQRVVVTGAGALSSVADSAAGVDGHCWALVLRAPGGAGGAA
jgi:hypothetical protein